MNIHFSFILSVIFLGFIIIVKRQIKQKEGMIENKKLILIGDSIFQNENYVEEGESIED